MMSDRVLFALQNIVGQTVLVQTKTGTVYQGIFKTADINPRLKEVTEIVLHMVYTVHEGVAGAKTAPPPLTAGEQVDGRPFRPRVQPTKEVAIAAADLVQVVVKDFGLLDDHSMAGGAGGDAGDVGTDAGIGKGKMAGLVGRELERWAPGADNAAGLAGAPAPTGVSLELGDGGGGGGGNYRRGGTCAGPVPSPYVTRACEFWGVDTSPPREMPWIVVREWACARVDGSAVTTAALTWSESGARWCVWRFIGKGSSAAWDQFGANEAMFGVQTSFDENFYTTALDKGNGGISEKEAERIAREIEGMSTTNSHLKEERNQQVGMEVRSHYDVLRLSIPLWPSARTLSERPSVCGVPLFAGASGRGGQVLYGDGPRWRRRRLRPPQRRHVRRGGRQAGASAIGGLVALRAAARVAGGGRQQGQDACASAYAGKGRQGRRTATQGCVRSRGVTAVKTPFSRYVRSEACALRGVECVDTRRPLYAPAGGLRWLRGSGVW